MEAIYLKRKNTLPIPKIIIGVVVLVAILLLFNKCSGSGSFEKVISSDGITQISVATNTGDIILSPHKGKAIRVQLLSKSGGKLTKHAKLSVKEKRNHLAINVKTKTRFSQGLIISVELPSKQFEALQVTADVANIDVGAIDVAQLYLATQVGNITVKNTIGAIQSKAEVGNVVMHFETITNNIVSKAEVGNIVVNVANAPPALQTNCSTSIGTATINLPNMNNGSIGEGGPTVELVTEVGDVSLLLVGE